MDPRNVVRAWELGHGRSCSFRALLLLALVYPEKTRQELAEVSLGQRNARLFAFREELFGPDMQALVKCPRCQASIEFSVSTREICTARPELAVVRTAPWLQEEFELEVRPPNSTDLDSERDQPRLVSLDLAQRCIREARRAGQPVPVETVPATVLAELSENLVSFDPHLETRLNLDCPDCEENWSSSFDIVSFVWAEIEALAKRLCGEVHTLASAYGWREPDILAMSPARRAFYLELV